MKRTISILIITIFVLLLIACGNAEKFSVIPCEIRWTVHNNSGYSLEIEPEDESVVSVSVTPCDVPIVSTEESDGFSVEHVMILKGKRIGETILHVSYVKPYEDADNYVTHELYKVIVEKNDNGDLLTSAELIGK